MADGQKCRTIRDLTSLINDVTYKIFKFRTANFNPSIAHCYGNVYIVSVRIISYNYTTDQSFPIENPINDLRHPWYSMWKPVGPSIDGTMFFLFKKNVDNDITYFKVLDIKTNKNMWKHGNIVNVGETSILTGAVDTRVFKHPNENNENIYILTFNAFSTKSPYNIANDLVENVKKTQTKTQTNTQCLPSGHDALVQNGCSTDYCGHIMYMFVKICDDIHIEKPYLEVALEPTLLCLNCSKKIEKNWAIGFLNGDFFISYGLGLGLGEHQYFKIEYNNNSWAANCAINKVESPISVEIKNVQNENKDIFFSLSTPYVDYNNEEFLAVGHVKIKYNEYQIQKTNTKDPKITAILKKLNRSISPDNHILHYEYMYMMYFYTIKKNDYTLSNISTFFVPLEDDNEKFSIFFPSGLCRVDNEIILSYGVGDICSKIAIFDIDDVNKIFNVRKQKTVVLDICRVYPEIKEHRVQVKKKDENMEIDEGDEGDAMQEGARRRNNKEMVLGKLRLIHVFYKKKWISISDAHKIEEKEIKLKLQKDREMEKLKIQKQKERENEKLKLKKQKEMEKLKLKKQKEMEKLKLKKQPK